MLRSGMYGWHLWQLTACLTISACCSRSITRRWSLFTWYSRQQSILLPPSRSSRSAWPASSARGTGSRRLGADNESTLGHGSPGQQPVGRGSTDGSDQLACWQQAARLLSRERSSSQWITTVHRFCGPSRTPPGMCAPTSMVHACPRVWQRGIEAPTAPSAHSSRIMVPE